LFTVSFVAHMLPFWRWNETSYNYFGLIVCLSRCLFSRITQKKTRRRILMRFLEGWDVWL